MSFVDQDCKVPVGVELGDILQNELELRGDLHKLPDRIPNLLVQINAVRNNDHSIKSIVVGCVFQRNQLVRQPCNGIRLS